MILSLIQTSQNRNKELARFVDSLNKQQDVDFAQLQLIFIDQGDNKDVFEQLNQQITFTYVKTEKCSLSHARNLGLPLVQGEYVGFPDDDCWYEPNTIIEALNILRKGEYQAVSGKGTNENGLLTSAFPEMPAKITSTNRCAAISYTMFFKYEKNVLFDENMGVGSPFNIGAGEETDYMLHLMEQYDFKVFYEPEIVVHHPKQSDVYDKEFMLKKYYSYSRGAGYLIKKHSFSFFYKLCQFGRPLCGIFVNLLMMRVYEARRSYYMFKGKLEGFLFVIPLKGMEE